MTAGPVTQATTSAPGAHHDEEMPRLALTRRRALLFAAFVASAVAFLYFVLPRLTGLSQTWHRLDEGDPWWLGVAFCFEVLSFLGYVWLFRTVFVRGRTRIDWRASYQITMAGLAATRLFAAAGAGGVALTAWALRRSGLERRLVACRMIAFLVLLYVVYALALVLVGTGLRAGVLPGKAPFGFTVVPAILGAALLAAAALVALLPGDAERRLTGWASSGGRFAHLIARAIKVPASAAAGLRTAWDMVAAREPGVLGAVMWWGFDICVLWSCFHAFGGPPPFAVVVMAYFVGMLANTLPLPGGVGGVDGGMIGTLLAFDVSPGLAVVAVLVYRGFSFWLPTVPGAVAYVQLRRTVSGWRASDARSA